MHHELVAVGVVGGVAVSSRRKKDRPKVRHVRRLSQSRDARKQRELRVRQGLELVTLKLYVTQDALRGLAVKSGMAEVECVDLAMLAREAEHVIEQAGADALRAEGYR